MGSIPPIRTWVRRGTALVPTAASNASRMSTAVDDGDAGGAPGRIYTDRLPAGPSGRWFESSRPDFPSKSACVGSLHGPGGTRLGASRQARNPRKLPGSSGHRARLEDDDRRLMRASCRVAVEVSVQFAPALPQPFALPADRGPPEHLALDPTGELDDRLRMGLQVQPPGWLGRTPAVHGHRDQVRPVLVVADDHAPRLATAPALRGEPQCAPLARAGWPQPPAPPAGLDDPPVQVPENYDEPARW